MGIDEVQKTSGVLDEHKAWFDKLTGQVADPNKGKEAAKGIVKKLP